MPAAAESSSAQKVCRLLRVLSTPQPLRLADICASTGLHKATALRLLESLVQEGFVERDAATKRFLLGEEALLLGLAMQGRDHVSKRARPWLVRLAGLSGDTIILSARRGNESVCIDREFGSYPIRANYLDIGSRRPLGVGAGSMALLAWLPEAEATAVLAEVAPMVEARYPRINLAHLEAERRQALARGHSILLDVVVERMGGIGVPIFGSDGKPVAAISLAALNERITPRLGLLVPALQEAAAALSVHHLKEPA